MGWFGPTELLIILLIILLVFGPSKLGDVGGALGKAIRDFKRAMNEDDETPHPPAAKPDDTKPGESKPGPTA
ncbi:MAG: twin-arginine translocase TatA/TatE family subunit [Candidatus Binataceae bacterium]